MKILDFNGKEISRGLTVKYIGTHTTGKVKEIKINEGLVWIKLDTNGLYYRSEYIEVIEGKNGYIMTKKAKPKIKSDQFKVEIPVEISDTTDGPGIGGG